MKNLILLLVLVLISACTRIPLSISDKEPGKIQLGMQSEMGNVILPQFQMHDFQMHVHFVSSDRLKDAYSFIKMRGFSGFAGRGMTQIDRKKKSCDVFIQRPHNPLGRGMLTLGHEVSH